MIAFAGTDTHLITEYDRLTGRLVAVEEVRLWSWEIMGYVTRPCRIISLGRQDGVRADPDAALTPDGSLFNGGHGARAVARLVDELERNGPGTTAELVERMGLPNSRADYAVTYAVNHSDGEIRVVGQRWAVDAGGAQRKRAVYGLAQHVGTIPELLPPTLAFLQQHPGEWYCAADIARLAGVPARTVDVHLRQNLTRLNVWPQQVARSRQMYTVNYYRWRG